MMSNNKLKPVEEPRPEMSANCVASVDFLNTLYNYLNTRPREEVNALCLGLENLPNVDVFLKEVDKHYAELPVKI